MTGRVFYAGLELLDHQLRDRDGRLCGNVDDLEIERSPDTGELYVTAFRIGPNIDLAVDAEDLATSDTERWVRDHLIGHLPGNRHRAPE